MHVDYVSQLVLLDPLHRKASGGVCRAAQCSQGDRAQAYCALQRCLLQTEASGVVRQCKWLCLQEQGRVMHLMLMASRPSLRCSSERRAVEKHVEHAVRGCIFAPMEHWPTVFSSAVCCRADREQHLGLQKTFLQDRQGGERCSCAHREGGEATEHDLDVSCKGQTCKHMQQGPAMAQGLQSAAALLARCQRVLRCLQGCITPGDCRAKTHWWWTPQMQEALAILGHRGSHSRHLSAAACSIAARWCARALCICSLSTLPG